MKRLGARGSSRTRHPAGKPLGGSVTVPGDKSISHRALVLAALAQGTSRIRGLNEGADVAATAEILRNLGVTQESSKGEVKVEGLAGAGFIEPEVILDCGNSGTTLRTMLAVCAPAEGAFVFTGDSSLRQRPMLRVVAPLRQMGSVIDGRDHGNLAPLLVRGRSLTGIDYELPIASAQVKTALLLAGLRAEGRTQVTEPGPSRDHTERMLGAAGVAIDREGSILSVEGGQAISPLDVEVPGDLSAAAFLLAAGLLVPGSDLTIEKVGLNPSRSGLLEVLEAMGADLEYDSTHSEAGEPIGAIRARHSPLVGVEVGGDIIGRLIDELPVLAVVATQAEGETRITDAAELRVKESDRIEALVSGLTLLGADVDALPDGLVVRGPTPLQGGVVDSHGDHRIAMAFAVGGLLAEEKVTVRGWSCVDTSFPGFLGKLDEARSR